jgi:hypothetical protein
MKPKVFVGSSKEALEFANAIHSALAQEAECTVWNVSFPISGITLPTLMRTVRSMDFCIFVFAPDNAVEIRGERYLVPGLNVIFELGLFTGHLEPERCFFVLPDTMRIHIPSNLQGAAHGTYEAGRSHGNSAAAVAPFCAQIRTKIKALGIASVSLPVVLHELATKYECADWIDQIDARVQRKVTIKNEMIDAFRRRSVEKRLFLAHPNKVGFKALLGAAIQAAPAIGDVELILATSAPTVPQGVAQSIMVEAIERLVADNLVSSEQRARLSTWLGQLPNVDPSLVERIAQLRVRPS